MGSIQSETGTAAPRTGMAGRVGITLFFLLWSGIPSVMLVMMAREIGTAAEPFFWRQGDCTILESRVHETGTDGDYALEVRYAYAAGPLSAVEAPPRQATVYARGYRGGSDYADAQRLALRYAPGTRAACYVDPDDPTQAVLARRVPLLVVALPLPLLFVTISVVGLWLTWRPRRAEPAGGAVSPAPISSGGRRGVLAGRGAWGLVAFFGLFFVVGAAVLVPMAGKVLKVFAARAWTPVTATVVSSNVRTHRGDDSTTYSVNILYSYPLNGREYRSNRYGFLGGSSSEYAGKDAIVSRHSPGTRFTAYVNPDDPVEAVIERGLTPDMLVLLVPLAFMSVGAVGGYFSARHARRAAPMAARPPDPAAGGCRAPARRYVVPSRPARATGSPRGIALQPRQSPAGKLAVMTGMALFWNGIVSVFLYHVADSWISGRGEVCLSIFIVPFVAVGVALVVGAFHSMLSLFNPRCELSLDCDALSLGDAAEFRWRFTGRYDRIHRLVIRVEGREEATYRQGTNTHSDKNIFHLQELLDTSRAVDIHRGKARCAIPSDSMHSFTAPNNSIVWVLCLHAHIGGWPDVKEEYALAVAPLPAEKLARKSREEAA